MPCCPALWWASVRDRRQGFPVDPKALLAGWEQSVRGNRVPRRHSLLPSAAGHLPGSIVPRQARKETPMHATLANMKRHYSAGVMCYSPFTHEEYSANPADYWHRADSWTMCDDEGTPMLLVVKTIDYLGVSA